MQLTRFRILLMLILAVTSSSLLVWHFTSAGPAPSRNAICTPGACGGASPCDIKIYIDSGQYGAANCRTGDNFGFNAVPDLGALWANQVTPNCPANGCMIFIETGSYNIVTTPLVTKDGYDVYGTYGQTVITATGSVTRGTQADAIFTTSSTVNSLAIHDLSLSSGYYAAGQWLTINPTASASTCCSYAILTTGGTVHSNMHLYNMVMNNFGNGFYLANSATNIVASNWSVHDIEVTQANDCGVIKSQNILLTNVVVNNINCYQFSDAIFDFVATNNGNSAIKGEFTGFTVTNINGAQGVTGGVAFEALATGAGNGAFHGITASNININYNRTFTSTGRIGLYFNGGSQDVYDFTATNIVVTNGDQGLLIKALGANGGGGVISNFDCNQCFTQGIFIQNSNPAIVTISDSVLQMRSQQNNYGIRLQANTNGVSGFIFSHIRIQNNAQVCVVCETQSGTNSFTSLVFDNINYNSANFTWATNTGSIGGMRWFGALALTSGSPGSPNALATTDGGSASTTANLIWTKIPSTTVLVAGLNTFFIHDFIMNAVNYPVLVSIKTTGGIVQGFTALAWDNSGVTAQQIQVQIDLTSGFTLTSDLVLILNVQDF